MRRKPFLVDNGGGCKKLILHDQLIDFQYLYHTNLYIFISFMLLKEQMIP
jgi:hypothetical protein